MFSKKIKELRIKNNLSQEELGNKLNLTANVVAEYETGKREASVYTLQAIAKIFDVPITCFIGDNIKVVKKVEDIKEPENVKEIETVRENNKVINVAVIGKRHQYDTAGKYIFSNTMLKSFSSETSIGVIMKWIKKNDISSYEIVEIEN